MIRKLSHFDQPVVSPEPETKVSQQPAVPESPRLGIAGNTDSFETANPIPANYSNLDVQQQFSSSATPVISGETVDASSMFDQFQQPLPSPLDSHFQKSYAARGIHLAGEKVNLKANVNSQAHINPKYGTDANIKLATNEDLKLGDATLNGEHASLSQEAATESMSLMSIGGDIVDGVGDMAGDAVDWVTDLPSDLGDLFWDGVDFVQDAFIETGKAIDDAGSAVGEFFSDTPVGDGARWFGEAVEDAADWAVDANWEFWAGVSDVGEFIGDVAAETPIPEVLDAAGEAVVDTTNFLANLILYPVATIDEAIEDTGNTIEGAAEDVGNFFQGVIEATGGAVEDTGNFLEDAADTAGELISDGVDWVGDGLDDLF